MLMTYQQPTRRSLFHFMAKMDKPMMKAALNLMNTDLMAIPQNEAVLKLRQHLRRLRVLGIADGEKEICLSC